MGQLAQDKAERPTRTFGANTKKNPKEECKAVLTRGQKKEQEEGKVEEEDQTEEYMEPSLIFFHICMC